MDRNVKCVSCGASDIDIGEGAVFCSGCNAALGIVNHRVIEWDAKMVSFDGILRGTFPEKGGVGGQVFSGESINAQIALTGASLQAKIDLARTIVDRIIFLLQQINEQTARLNEVISAEK